MKNDIIKLKIEPLQSHTSEKFSYNFLLDKAKENIFQHIPEDYLKFIRKYGEGIIDECIRIFPITRVVNLTNSWREMGYPRMFRKKYSKNISKEFLTKAILLGDSVDGDQIIFHANAYFVFCFNGEIEKLYKLKNLDAVFDFFKSGKYWGEMELKTFTPFNSHYILNGLEYLVKMESQNYPYKVDEKNDPHYTV